MRKDADQLFEIRGAGRSVLFTVVI